MQKKYMKKKYMKKKYMNAEINNHLKTLNFDQFKTSKNNISNQSINSRRPFRLILFDDDKVVKLYEKTINNTECNIIMNVMNYNICPKIISISYTKNYVFITMEKLNGTLDDIIEQVTIDDIQNILDKMKLLWNMGYKHGDFHPKNVLFTKTIEGLEWYIIDYEYSEKINHKYHDMKEFILDKKKNINKILYDIYMYDQQINSLSIYS